MDDAVASLRAFNRFYTRFAGVLDAHYMDSGLSLAEARALYEIAQREAVLAADIQAELGLDAGYVSRILRRFEARGWIIRARGSDARRRPISLTAAGREAFEMLDARTRDHTAGRLAGLPDTDQAALITALDAVRGLLGGNQSVPWAIRTFRTGDMGMIAARQSILYAPYGWGPPMEALQGEVTAAFLRNFKPGREQCWVAERAGVMAGSVFLVDSGDNAAQLRLLYVEPHARGLGIGEALVRTCVDFAQEAGYERIWLWTHSVLLSARRIYSAIGFERTSVEMHGSFGQPAEGETWEMKLGK